MIVFVEDCCVVFIIHNTYYSPSLASLTKCTLSKNSSVFHQPAITIQTNVHKTRLTMTCCLLYNTQYTIEEQVSLSAVDSLNSKVNNYTVIRTIFALWTWIVMGYSLWWEYVPKLATIYDHSSCCIQYWPIYFTDWGLTFVSLYWLCITYLHLKVNHGNLLTSTCDLVIIFIMKLSYITGLVFSILIGM